MMRHLYLTLAASLALAGCSANIAVEEISKPVEGTTAKPDNAIDGVPFRVDKPFMAHVFHKVGAEYVELGHYPVTVPDPTRLYVLKFNGHPFSNGSVDLVLDPDDGTIQSMTVKSTSTGQADLTAAGTQLSAVATALASARTGGVTARNTLQDAGSAAELAHDNAEIALQKLKDLQASSSPSPLDLLQAIAAARQAQINANNAAVRSGGAPPYAAILPLPSQ